MNPLAIVLILVILALAFGGWAASGSLFWLLVLILLIAVLFF